MIEIEFRTWPKTPRLFRSCTITEKLDGTNSAIGIVPYFSAMPYTPENVIARLSNFEPKATPSGFYSDFNTDRLVYAQSRKRLITPEQDNYGFAKWVQQYAIELATILGDGLHFGEYWGSGIQRGYNLKNGDKRFSLFNVNRYAEADFSNLPNAGLVPILYQGPFTTDVVNETVEDLREYWSRAVPGYANPEGVITFHEAAQQVFKTTLENDESPKGSKE